MRPRRLGAGLVSPARHGPACPGHPFRAEAQKSRSVFIALKETLIPQFGHFWRRRVTLECPRKRNQKMSRAFTKETAESAAPPERMIEEGPNPVTPEGMKQIDDHIARIESAMQSETNVLLRETLARDLRYWMIRKSTAEIVHPASDGTVAFGSTVTIARKGRKQTFRIVGVDEADPSKGLISFRAPLAKAVMGARAGDVIEADEMLGEIEIIEIR